MKYNFSLHVKSKLITVKGKRTINQYSIVGTLGEGSYAKVKLCIKNDSREFVVFWDEDFVSCLGDEGV